MKPSKLIHMTAALAAAAVLSQTQLPAQTLDPWQTVDDFQLVPGLAASGSIGTDASGTLVFGAGGGATDTANHWSGVISRSADAGQTWDTVNVFPPPPGMTRVSFGSPTADPISGRLYVAGNITDTVQHWFVRHSDDAGVNWSTDELFLTPSICIDIESDRAGNVYAGGDIPVTTPMYDVWTMRRRDAGSGVWKTVDVFGTKSAPAMMHRLAVHPTAGVFAVGGVEGPGTLQWTVRRSLDGISSWKTVDSFAMSKGMISIANGVAAGGPGTIYVVGSAYSTVSRQQVANWVVRRSTNGGTTWSTVDTFRYSNGTSVSPSAAMVDGAGAIWVVGIGSSATGAGHWLVRKGTPNPVTGALSWKTSDDFQAVSGQYASALGITADATGNVFVSGQASDATGTPHWVVRKLSAL